MYSMMVLVVLPAHCIDLAPLSLPLLFAACLTGSAPLPLLDAPRCVDMNRWRRNTAARAGNRFGVVPCDIFSYFCTIATLSWLSTEKGGQVRKVLFTIFRFACPPPAPSLGSCLSCASCFLRLILFVSFLVKR